MFDRRPWPRAPITSQVVCAIAVSATITTCTVLWAQPAAETKPPTAIAADGPSRTESASGGKTVRAATFRGVEVGVSTAADVERAWGKPSTVAHHFELAQWAFQMEPFARLEVTLHKDRVLSITVTLREAFPPELLAGQMGVADIEPVLVADEHGAFVGQVYPERGAAVSFVAGDASRRANQIVLDTIQAQPFVLRAQARMASNLSGSLADLDAALSIQPSLATALAERAQLRMQLGAFDRAREDARAAVKAEPNAAAHRLTLAAIDQAQGLYDEAVANSQHAIGLANNDPLAQARGIAQLAELVAHGPHPDTRLSVDYFQQALRLVEPLQDSADPATRSAAKTTALEAHLGVAVAIASGRWKNKGEAVGRWLDRASQLAAGELPSPEQASVQMRVCRRALEACAAAEGQIDPTPWMETLNATARQQIATLRDPQRVLLVEWELGLGLDDALQAYRLRGDPQAALRAGGLATAYLERAAQGRPQTSGATFHLGELYYHLGAVHALDNKDHRQALNWFDRATPLLSEPSLALGPQQRGRQGETLVSMGVSYWAVGQKDRALEVTRQGVELVENAVRSGGLQQPALAVPYSNLATIHEALGNRRQADGFEALARQANNAQLR